MELGTEGLAQQDTLDKLMSILPDEGYESDGQAEASTEPKKEEPKPETPSEPVQTTEPEDIEIEFEGNKYKLPPELKDAFLRQQDYTKKTMELAEQRKAIGDPKEIEQYKQKLSTYEAILGQQVQQDQKTDWVKLLETDPIEYLKQKELSEARAREWQQVSAQKQAELAEQTAKSLTTEWEQLLAKQPEWKDEAVRKADREKIESFLTKSGYAKEDIASIADHRALLVADKARRYDELMAAKSEVAKKIEKLPPKVERPGVPSGEDSQGTKSAMDKLRKTGSVDDAAAAFMRMLG